MSVSQTTHLVSSLLLLLVTFFSLTSPATSSIESFIYAGCAQYKYMPGSTYESDVNSLFTSLVNSATSTTPYNQFTIPASTATQDTVYGFFQCRGDLSSADCFSCVAHAVTQLGTICVHASGGGLQLEGCLVKYDNTTFLGVEDKSLLWKKCGPVTGYDSDALTRRDAILGYIGTDDGTAKPYRYSASGGVQAVAQCVQDLDRSKCQDCLTEAISQLKTNCDTAKWGDMFLGKCYVRYSEGVDFSGGGNSNRLHHSRWWRVVSRYFGSLSVLLVLHRNRNQYII